jgi:hypothetical protein
MVNIPPQMEEGVRYVASFFQVRPEWLLWPNVATIFAIPLVLNVLMVYYALHRIIKVFPNSVNWMIAGVVGFMMLPFNNITMWVAPLAIGFLGPSRWIFKIVVVVVIYAVQFLVIPIVTGEISRIRL